MGGGDSGCGTITLTPSHSHQCRDVCRPLLPNTQWPCMSHHVTITLAPSLTPPLTLTPSYSAYTCTSAAILEESIVSTFWKWKSPSLILKPQTEDPGNETKNPHKCVLSQWRLLAFAESIVVLCPRTSSCLVRKNSIFLVWWHHVYTSVCVCVCVCACACVHVCVCVHVPVKRESLYIFPLPV